MSGHIAFRNFAFASLIAALVTMPSAAFAQKACAPRGDIVSKLKEKYGEDQNGMGLSGTSALVEIWSSDKTGTWTIVMTRPNGVTCILAAGESWASAPPPPAPET